MYNKHVEDKDTTIKIEQKDLKKVEHFIYLGHQISMKFQKEEIKRIITLGWQVFGRASSIFNNNKTPLVVKRRVYNQCTLPLITYGAETWNLTKGLALILRSMLHAHE